MSISDRWWRRYEHILDAKPMGAKDALVVELGKAYAELLKAFPPDAHDIEWSDERLRARFEPALATFPRIDDEIAEIVRYLVVGDLTHETEEIDRYFKSGAFAAATKTPVRGEVVHFLWPAVIEMLLAWKESAQLALTRKDLVEIVEAGHARFRAGRVLVV